MKLKIFVSSVQKEFVVTLRRDWLTDRVMTGLGLNDRQKQAVAYLKSKGFITNAEYQAAFGTTRITAKRDLEDLTDKGIVALRGSGRGSHYEFLKKRLINGSNGTRPQRTLRKQDN